MAYNYSKRDRAILKGRTMHFYPYFFAIARAAGWDSLLKYAQALYIKHESTVKVADIFKVTPSTIRKWLLLVGCKINSKGGARGIGSVEDYAEEDRILLNGRGIRGYTELLEKAQNAGYNSLLGYIQVLYREYASSKEVGKIIGVSDTSIRNWMRAVNLS